MEKLNKCLVLRKKINDIEEKLEDIAYSIKCPKIPTVSDMPRSTSISGNPIERYIEKQEKYENEKLLLETELNMLWNSIDKRLIACGTGKSERQLIYLRFNRGYSWKKCTAIMRKAEGQKWNENRTFRIYRKTVKNLQNAV